MDRFLIRTSNSWRTADSTFARSFANKSFTDKKSTPKADARSRRLSIRDETLLKIISSQPDQPLNDENLNPIEVFRSSSQPAKINESFEEEKSHKGMLLGTRPAIADCQAVADRTAHESANARNLEVMSMTPPTDVAPSSAENVFAKNKALQSRLQRDLDSPSANARFRAMKALKSPTKTCYATFDVPYEEQDIITEEERNRPKSIQEVMKDVVIYVEVRTGEDNRSAGVKNVISQLGARVNDRFLRDTTHVVFKDGLQSTFNKAKKWNIPIVSILWIEACKKHTILMNPQLFPISNIERYENPELYTKIKRQKSMQPNAEENVRRHKVKLPGAAASKETDNATQAVKKARRISVPRKPKDKPDELLFDSKGKLSSTSPCNGDVMELDSKIRERTQNSPFTSAIAKGKQNNKVDSLKQYAVLDSNIEEEENSDDDFEIRKPIAKTTETSTRMPFDKKIISSAAKRQSSTSVLSPTKRRATMTPQMKTPGRRTSILASNDSAKKSETPSSPKQERSTRVTRRSSISLTEDANTISKRKHEVNLASKTVILEESCDTYETNPDENRTTTNETAFQDARNRKTTFTSLELDITKNPLNTNTPKPSTFHRHTLLTPRLMDETIIQEGQQGETGETATPKIISTAQQSLSPFKTAGKDISKSIALTSDNWRPSIRKSARRRTTFMTSYNEESNDAVYDSTTLELAPAVKPVNLFAPETPTPKLGTILDELNSSLTFDSAKTPASARRRTMFDISMDIIGQRVQNINKSAKLSRDTELKPNEDDICTPKTTADIQEKAVENLSIPEANGPQTLGHSTVSSFAAGLNDDSFKTSTKLAINESAAAKTPIQPKKRKLFAPTELLFATPPDAGASQKDKIDELHGNLKKKSKTDIKAVKTIRRINGASGKKEGSKISRSQGRRSTLDFEQVKKIRATKTVQSAKQPEEAKSNYMVCTNMHTEQLHVIKQAIEKLGGGFKLEGTVSDRTTHVISLEPRRTFNLLRGIVRGLWILSYTWITESIESGKWLFEEPYEMIHFSRGVEIARSQRQAFGPTFKIDIFADIAPIYVSPNSNVPSQNVEELIRLCSGKITREKDKAKYILGESAFINPGKICLSALWILDSIQDSKVKKIVKYIIDT